MAHVRGRAEREGGTTEPFITALGGAEKETVLGALRITHRSVSLDRASDPHVPGDGPFWCGGGGGRGVGGPSKPRAGAGRADGGAVLLRHRLVFFHPPVWHRPGGPALGFLLLDDAPVLHVLGEIRQPEQTEDLRRPG